jgi:hypothetical protein
MMPAGQQESSMPIHIQEADYAVEDSLKRLDLGTQ